MCAVIIRSSELISRKLLLVLFNLQLSSLVCVLEMILRTRWWYMLCSDEART